MTTVVRIEVADEGHVRPEVRTIAEAVQEFDGGPDNAATAFGLEARTVEVQVTARDGGAAPDGPVTVAIGNGHRAS